jgi:signal transduction histidine kinase
MKLDMSKWKALSIKNRLKKGFRLTTFVASASGVIYILIIISIIAIFIHQAKEKYRVRQEMLKHKHLEEINESKLQFFINISHEIRTPMSLIISPLQKLISTDNDSERQKSYSLIERNAQRILNLINQLMDIER